MIYTLTVNPSIDYIVGMQSFTEGSVNRAESERKYPGGKGINVSRILNNLGVKSVVMGFVGGFTGRYIKRYLEDEGVICSLIAVQGDTRINVKIKAGLETEINGMGPEITEENVRELLKKTESMTKNDFLVLAGSIQSTLPRDFYAQIQQRCISSGVKVLVDTTGESLLSTLPQAPFLIKPNIDELEELFDCRMESMETVVYYAQQLRKMGALNVVVSMANKGAVLVNGDGVYHATAPGGTVKNSVGAGDSLIGGFMAKYQLGGNITEAFCYGVAAGSATAFSLDLCRKEEVERLADKVKLYELKG